VPPPQATVRPRRTALPTARQRLPPSMMLVISLHRFRCCGHKRRKRAGRASAPFGDRIETVPKALHHPQDDCSITTSANKTAVLYAAQSFAREQIGARPRESSTG
jgi:hypothetical protein